MGIINTRNILESMNAMEREDRTKNTDNLESVNISLDEIQTI